MWVTEIKSKTITNGLLQVVVSFSDGKQTFTDRYETRSTQDSNWLDENIKRRIADLDGVVSFADTIQVGVYSSETKQDIIDNTILTKKDEYKNKLSDIGVIAV